MGEDLEYKCKQERVGKIGEKYINIAMRDIEEDIQKVFENEKDFIKEEDNDFFPEEYEDDDEIAHYHH